MGRNIYDGPCVCVCMFVSFEQTKERGRRSYTVTNIVFKKKIEVSTMYERTISRVFALGQVPRAFRQKINMKKNSN